MQSPEQITEILEWFNRAKTIPEKQQALGALIDAMIAQSPEWAAILAFPDGPLMQDARGAFLDVLEEIIHEGAEVRFVLSDDVKHRLAEKHAARRAQHTSTMVDILQRNPGAEIRLPKYMFDHVMAALRSGTPVKFDA